MGRKPSLNQTTSGTHAVDELLGEAYKVVRNVEEKLPEIQTVSENIGTILTAATLVADALPALEQSAEDAAAVAADRIAVAADREAVAADKTTVTTATDLAAEHATSANSSKLAAGGYAADADADRVQTGLDRIAVAADKDAVDTAAGLIDMVNTNVTALAEAVATNKGLVDTAKAAVDLAKTATDGNATDTAADRVQTGLDRVAAAASAAAAAQSAIDAENAAGGGVIGFNGRSGAVVPLANDYNADQINEAGTTKKFTDAAGLAKLANITVTAATDLDTIRTRVNSLDAAVVLSGDWSAATGAFPSGAQRGESFIVNVAGTVGGVDFSINDRVVALVDGASTTVYATNWLKLDYTDQVLSVAGKTGAVTLAKADVGLGNVDNTPDANKPVSTSQQTALDLKLNTSGGTLTGPMGFTHQGSPANPAAGQLVLFAKNDNKFYTRTSDGTETVVGSGSMSQVATRTALKALDTTGAPQALLVEDGRVGVFAWRSGDYAARVAADTAEGIYIKADSTLASAGAWVRLHTGPLDVRWFGATNDNAGNAQAGIQAAVDLAEFLGSGITEGPVGSVWGPPGFYRCTAGIALSKSIVFRLEGQIYYTPTTGSAVILTDALTTQHTFYDVDIEGIRAVNGNVSVPTSINAAGCSAIEIRRLQFSRVRVGQIIGFTRYGAWLNSSNDVFTGQHVQDNDLSFDQMSYCGVGIYAESVSASDGACQVNRINIQNAFASFRNVELGGTADNNTNHNILSIAAIDVPGSGGSELRIFGWYNRLVVGFIDTGGTVTFATGSAYNYVWLGRNSANVVVSDAGAENTIEFTDGGKRGSGYRSKSADQSVVSSTTLVDDTELQFNMQANTKYRIELEVLVWTGNATPGWKFGFSAPAAPSDIYSFVEAINNATAVLSNTKGSLPTGAYVPNGVNALKLKIFMLYYNGPNAGTFKFQWAQNTSNAAAVFVRAGSIIRYAVA